MVVSNPLPLSLKSEIKRAASILEDFIKPNQVLGADQVIPPHILKNAKGLAIITVLKAGFLFSGRAGSGVIVARLKDGSWSGPSAIALMGAGAGGMIGAELTDFVFILNTYEAVRCFSFFNTFTLGGNISVSAGPMGRNAEVAASASLTGVSAVFAYSKSKGLFAGVSVEGSVIMERREANRKLYGDNCTAKMILSGKVRPPPAAEPLLRVLSSRMLNYGPTSDFDANDSYDESYGNNSWDDSGDESGYSKRYSEEVRPGDHSNSNDAGDYCASRSSLEDDVDDLSNRFSRARLSPGAGSGASTEKYVGSGAGAGSGSGSGSGSAPKVVALYSFPGEEEGDLPFRKGDVITVLKKTDSQNDWWTGRVNGREGIFPANYVELV